MKLASKIDLEPLRQAALAVIDQKFLTRMSKCAFYNIKFEWASSNETPQAIVDEAAIKGVRVSDLKALIIAKHKEAEEELMKLEVQRQKDKLAVSLASSEQELKAWLS